MSGIKNSNSSVNGDGTPSAFEYVAGTLPPDERKAFEKQLLHSPQLQLDVQFWEAQLMYIQPRQERQPNKRTWDKIHAAINPQDRQAQAKAAGFDWRTFWQWISPTVAATVLIVAMFGYYPGGVTTTVPNMDYVAVLTDENGKALLTAMTTGDDKKMWLQWEQVDVPPDTNLQLWSVSKRDGQVRPLTVFASSDIKKIQLDEAKWRLVTDSEFLLLTEEEVGGSAIDEPSDILLAKGFCVRFNPDEKTI